MGNVMRSEKLKTSQPASMRSDLHTPPKSPNTTLISAQALAYEIRDIYHALSELPDLTPGSKVNSLLTRLVSLCIPPYSREFITHFSGIEGVHALCEKLRPLCATAEGELENFWAGRITEESRRSKGMFRFSLPCICRTVDFQLRISPLQPLTNTHQPHPPRPVTSLLFFPTTKIILTSQEWNALHSLHFSLVQSPRPRTSLSSALDLFP